MEWKEEEKGHYFNVAFVFGGAEDPKLFFLAPLSLSLTHHTGFFIMRKTSYQSAAIAWPGKTNCLLLNNIDDILRTLWRFPLLPSPPLRCILFLPLSLFGDEKKTLLGESVVSERERRRFIPPNGFFV